MIRTRKVWNYCLVAAVLVLFYFRHEICQRIFYLYTARPHRPIKESILPEPFGHFSAEEPIEMPLILMWTGFFWGDYSDRMRVALERCPNRCRSTSNKKLVSEASAVLFHIVDYNHTNVPRIRHPNQSYVFFMHEPPTFFGAHMTKNDFFNLSMTFRTDSDVPMPYGKFTKRDGTEKPGDIFTEAEVREKVGKKTKLVAWFVSRCSTPGGREFYVDALKKHVQVDVFGACGSHCDKPCEEKIIGDYKFIIAMENSVCRDYVTEKFWRVEKLIVPIVLRNADAARVAPNGSYIAVDQFNGVTKLAEYLKQLDKDNDAYMKYFEWTKTHRRNLQIDITLCELCDLLRKPNRPPKTYDAASWNAEGVCEVDYAKRFINATV